MNKGIMVIKVGTAILSEASGKLDVPQVESLIKQVCRIVNLGYKLVLVSSGAIGAGMQALGLSKRPRELSKMQATAAVGQSRLMKLYDEGFNKYNMKTAQVLLTQEDFTDRKRFLNAKHTLMTLIDEFKVIPVVNENDAVANEEIKFGDNDRLSSLVASLVNAQTLIILTDVDGLYSPEDKRVIPLVNRVDTSIIEKARPSKGRLGTGGMLSKLEAAKITMQAGITCIVANGRTRDILLRIENKEPLGTRFLPTKINVKGKKNWLAFAPKSKGVISVDDGAMTALVSRNKSLLAAGIKDVTGSFEVCDVVTISCSTGGEFARGVVNFSAKELGIIKGLRTHQIEEALRRKIKHNEVIHKDNLVVII